jgi:Sec7-like guanine-nucleotide exchange factor
MRGLIKKILVEETTNKIPLCDKLNVNSKEEIIDLLKDEYITPKQKISIKNILLKLKKDMDRLPTKLDTLDTYFHDIQDVMCRK